MRNLETKYLRNQLTSEELNLLREKVNSLSDDEIAASMQDRWVNGNIDKSIVPVERLNIIKEKIDRTIAPVRRVVFRQKITSIAAAILLPALLLSTLYLYHENRTWAVEEMIVSTKRGERANITLPDGTNVTVNSESSLRYAPQTFNRSERSVKFEGEAYFDVAKRISLPFVILTNDLRIRVLGTKFNLSARINDKEVLLSLEEGHVSLFSFFSKDEKEVFANQQAVLDKLTGVITIISVPEIKTNSSWRHNELIFGNAHFSDVLTALENNYNITITMPAGINSSDDLFTGMIPSNNILEALEIIKLAYHLNYTLLGNQVTFNKK